MSDYNLKVKPGDWIAVRVRKVTIRDDYVYLTLELPDLQHPYVNYPTLRIYLSKAGEVEPLVTKEESEEGEDLVDAGE